MVHNFRIVQGNLECALCRITQEAFFSVAFDGLSHEIENGDCGINSLKDMHCVSWWSRACKRVHSKALIVDVKFDRGSKNASNDAMQRWRGIE